MTLEEPFELKYWQAFYQSVTASVHPENCLPHYLPDGQHFEKTKILSVGKAASAMAIVAARYFEAQNTAFSGLCICPYGHAKACDGFEQIEANHPTPDQNSIKAGERALAMAGSIEPGELFLVLMSGGASSLMCAPVPRVTLAEKQDVTERLMLSGASIAELNTVRQAFSRIKNGGLLKAVNAGAQVLTLAISDVVSDDPSLIGSGPSVEPRSVEDKARDILIKFNIGFEVPRCEDTNKLLAGNSYQIVGSSSTALETAALLLEGQGYDVINLGGDIEGEARDVAAFHSTEIELRSTDAAQKLAFISGGELTVTVKGTGKGGPNQEYLLALMRSLKPGLFAGFAADTDGRDGSGGAAGAFFNSQLHRGCHDFDTYLRDNNSLGFFGRLGSSFITEPTQTNVNDIRVTLYVPGL
ncbi:MAG: DUF4147 domain-containing protein [Kordiimonadaceae bacterium]|nr:DUF4147 domain-containing protein [Kordiimonadaceae bacterium]